MPTVKAYSYVRFSSILQEKNDSLRRQTKGSEELAAKKGYVLDTSLNLQDLSVSAFRGTNVKEGALAGFLQAVKEKRVPSGSVLIVESLDRLTRDELSEALALFIAIIQSGVRIATLIPEREYTKASLNNIGELIEPLIIFVRAHEESATKSKRLMDAWTEKRKNVAQKVMTAKSPAWCKVKEDRSGFELISEKAEVVRQIFEWAAAGVGVNVITRRLNKSVAPMGRKPTWHRSYVLKILRSRAVLGEFQPHKGRVGKSRKTVGTVLKGYYPAVVSEQVFYSVQSALKSRTTARGRTGKTVANLFTGLVRDGRDKATMNMIDKGDGRQLVSSKALRGVTGSKYLGFDYSLFERAFLAFIREFQPGDVRPPASGKVDDVAELTGRVQELEDKIRKTKAKFAANPDVDALLDLLTDLERERMKVSLELETAKGKQANNEVIALEETKSLVALMEEASGDELESMRFRLRQKIRFVVSEMWVLVWQDKTNWHPIDSSRETTFLFVEVQVKFTTGDYQHYFLENKTGMYFGGSFRGETDIDESERLDNYGGWYDCPLEEMEDSWVKRHRQACLSIAAFTMRETSDDKRLEGVRAPTVKEREALGLVASGRGSEVHWRTVGSLVRRGWAVQGDDGLELTEDGRQMSGVPAKNQKPSVERIEKIKAEYELLRGVAVANLFEILGRIIGQLTDESTEEQFASVERKINRLRREQEPSGEEDESNAFHPPLGALGDYFDVDGSLFD